MTHILVECWLCGKSGHTGDERMCEFEKCYQCNIYNWVLTDDNLCFSCLKHMRQNDKINVQDPLKILGLVLRHCRSKYGDFKPTDENSYFKLFEDVFKDDPQIIQLLPYLYIQSGTSEETSLVVSSTVVESKDKYKYYY